MSKDKSFIYETFDVPLYVAQESSTKIVVNVKGENTDADYELSYARSEDKTTDNFRDESQQSEKDYGLRLVQIKKDEKKYGVATWSLTQDALGKTLSIKSIDQAGVQIYP